eukprot:6297198-Pyramimonas_sp.AAC.1
MGTHTEFPYWKTTNPGPHQRSRCMAKVFFCCKAGARRHAYTRSPGAYFGSRCLGTLAPSLGSCPRRAWSAPAS